MSKLSDCWQTPDWLFKELDKEFNFDIDLCATSDNSKKLDFCEDYLNNVVTAQNTYQTWDLYRAGFGRLYKSAFMNPPYSNPKPFIKKAWEDSKHCKIVCLVPNTIKTCKYMDILDANKGNTTFRQWLPGLEIRDLSRRTGFVHPEKESSSPGFGCMLLIMDRRGL